jgi:hypothetical protein
MATTRRFIDYGDRLTNAARNEENSKVFLMVRDGMNIYRVFSPVESHLGAARLFPSKNEQDSIFKGYDGSDIKFEDVAYTDALASHESHALHYKRFLLLVCGLDHRMKLFGDFYDGPQSLNFVSLAFQERYCRFLHDDDGSGFLPGETRQPLEEWIAEKNAYLRSGSRVLCNWVEVMNPDTAPGACKENNDRRRGYERRYAPANAFDMVIAYRDGNSICVDIEVRGYNYSKGEDRSFNCKVNLTKFKDGKWNYTDLPFLCIDAVEPEELKWYIYNREMRKNHLTYIRFFKRAVKFLEQERAEEHDTRKRMADALAVGNIAHGDEADAIVQQAVIAWRAANRGKALPRWEGNSAPAAWKSLLDQMFMLAGEGKRRIDDVAAFVRGLGYEPLRLVLSGGAKLMVYAAPTAEERDDRLEPHPWVHCITVEKGKATYIEKSRRWSLLSKSVASETTLHQWDAAQSWVGKDTGFASYERKQEMLAKADQFKNVIAPFTSTMTEEVFHHQFTWWKLMRRHINLRSQHVENPYLLIPFGVVYSARAKRARYLCLASFCPHAVLYQLAPSDEARNKLRSEFIDSYRYRDMALERFNEGVEGSKWWILEVDPATLQSPYFPFVESFGSDYYNVGRAEEIEPLLGPQLAQYIAKKANGVSEWLTDGVQGEQGELLLDRILNLSIPQDFKRMKVVHVTLRKKDDAEDIPFGEWYDVLPREADSEEEDNGRGFGLGHDLTHRLVRSEESKRTVQQSGWSAGGFDSASPEKARDALCRDAVKRHGKAFRVALSTEFPTAPQPPEGIERWYVVPVSPVEK